MAAEPAVMTLKETAAYLRKGQRQTREAAIRGELPECHKFGRDWRCSRVLLERRFPREEEAYDLRRKETAPESVHSSAA